MEKTNTNPEREIDLSILLSRAFKSVRIFIEAILGFIVKCLSYVILFGFKNYIVLGITLLIGIIFGVVKNRMSEELFKSDMILQSNEIPTEDMIAKINELGIYAEEGNYLLLAQKLDLDTTVTKQIKGIGAYWFIDTDRDGVADIVDYKNAFNALEDTTSHRMKDLLAVRAMVSHSNAFSFLQKGILTFLKNDPRLSLMNNNRKTGLQLKINRIDQELQKLDSLQNYEYFEKEKEMSLDLGNLGSLKVLGEEKDTRLLHSEIITLQDTRLAYERQLKVTGDLVSVVTDFPVSVKPSRSLGFDGLFYGSILLLIVYILLFAVDHRKAVLKYLEEKS